MKFTRAVKIFRMIGFEAASKNVHGRFGLRHGDALA